MEDLANYLLRMEMHKQKGEFGNMLKTNAIKTRVHKMNDYRKSKRSTLMIQRRQISVDNTLSKKVNKQEQIEIDNTSTMNRLKKLAQWKAEREQKKLAEKKKEKPIFITCVRSSEVSIVKVNENTNGNKTEKSNLAPANYQFKAPVNIKPVYFQQNAQNNTFEKNQLPSKVMTRSQSKKSNINIESIVTNGKKIESKVNTKKIKPPLNNNIKSTRNTLTLSNKNNGDMSEKNDQNTENTNEIALITSKSAKKKRQLKGDQTSNELLTLSVEDNPTALINQTIDGNIAKISQLENTPGPSKTIKHIRSSPKTPQHKNTITKAKPLSSNKAKNSLIIRKLSTEIEVPGTPPDSKNLMKTKSASAKRKSSTLPRNKRDESEKSLNENRHTKGRSRSSIANKKSVSDEMSPLIMEANSITEMKTTTPKKKSLKRITLGSSSSLSMEYPINSEIFKDSQLSSTPNKANSSNSKTPENKTTPNYISPFVTLSRGKKSARNEYVCRKFGKGVSPKVDAELYSSPKAGANYFTVLLDNEIERIEEMNQLWTNYKETENLPEEAHSLIDTTIGQSKLLLTKKFEQFRNLIESCKNQNGEQQVTCEDLHGFWDMVYIQVENINKRFANLENLKSNNWEEVIPVPKVQPKKRRGRPVKNVKSTSSLREAIKAAKKQKQDLVDPVEPKIEIITSKRTPKRTPKRKSVLAAVSDSQAKDHRNSSPGLMMMKVAQFAKNLETPGRGILKTDVGKSTGKSKQKVAFEVDIENDLNQSNVTLNSTSKGKTPNRRSIRLSRAKLF